MWHTSVDLDWNSIDNTTCDINNMVKDDTLSILTRILSSNSLDRMGCVFLGLPGGRVAVAHPYPADWNIVRRLGLYRGNGHAKVWQRFHSLVSGFGGMIGNEQLKPSQYRWWCHIRLMYILQTWLHWTNFAKPTFSGSDIVTFCDYNSMKKLR